MTHTQMLALAERIKKSTLPNTISPDMVGSLFQALVGSGVADTPVLQLKIRQTARYPDERNMVFVRFANRFADSADMAGYSFYVLYWHRRRKKWSHRCPVEKRDKFVVKVTACHREENDPSGWMLLPWTAQSLGNSLIRTKSKGSMSIESQPYFYTINCAIVAMQNNTIDPQGTFGYPIQESSFVCFKILVSKPSKTCSFVK